MYCKCLFSYFYHTPPIRHFDVAVFHTKYQSDLVVEIVVGNATVDASNLLPNVTVCEPVAVTIICKIWSSVGVPLKFVVKDVISTVPLTYKYLYYLYL